MFLLLRFSFIIHPKKKLQRSLVEEECFSIKCPPHSSSSMLPTPSLLPTSSRWDPPNDYRPHTLCVFRCLPCFLWLPCVFSVKVFTWLHGVHQNVPIKFAGTCIFTCSLVLSLCYLSISLIFGSFDLPNLPNPLGCTDICNYTSILKLVFNFKLV